MKNSSEWFLRVAVCGTAMMVAMALPNGSSADPSADFAQPHASNDPDLLPFAGNEIPITYPSFSFSFGVAPHVTRLSDVERGLQAMEEAYRDVGFPVHQQAEVPAVPMLTSAVTLHLNKSFDVALEIGRSPIKDDDIALAAGIVSGRLPLLAGGKASLIAGLGAGAYRFKFTRSYGVSAPAPTGGGHYTLERLTLSGGGAYWTAVGGVEFRANRGFAVAAQVRYLGMNDVTTDTEGAGRIKVNLGGVMVGGSLTYFF